MRTVEQTTDVTQAVEAAQAAEAAQAVDVAQTSEPDRTYRNGYDGAMALADNRDVGHSWTFLTNHAHVLIAIDRDPDVRQRDIADAVGVTIGAVQKIIVELERGGYLERERVGRRNHYRVNPQLPLRHPLESNHTVGELLRTLDD